MMLPDVDERLRMVNGVLARSKQSVAV